MRAPKATSLMALISAGLLCLAQGAVAQSLAEIATRQKEKRKGKQTKVYTEEDLKKGPARGFSADGVPAGDDEAAAPTSPAQGEGAGGAAPAPPAQKSDDELKAERASAWRDKIGKARDNVLQLTSEVSRIETALNDLTVPIYGTARSSRMAALDKAKQQLSAAQQSVADLEEEGRRGGFR